MGTRWGASRRFLSGRAVLHKPPPLSEWACTAPSEHPWGVDWMALQAPPVSGCAAQAYPSGLSEEAGVWVCEISGWSLCRDSREWLCTPVGIWGASALFVGPVGVGVPACALSCSPLVRVCVRERHESESEDAQSCPTQQPTRLLCPWDCPGKGTGVGHHCLLPRT